MSVSEINSTELINELTHIFAGANYHFLLKQYMTWKHLITTSDGNLKENFKEEMTTTMILKLAINFTLLVFVVYAYFHLYKEFSNKLPYLVLHTSIAGVILALDYGFILSIIYMVIVVGAQKRNFFY